MRILPKLLSFGRSQKQNGQHHHHRATTSSSSLRLLYVFSVVVLLFVKTASSWVNTNHNKNMNQYAERSTTIPSACGSISSYNSNNILRQRGGARSGRSSNDITANSGGLMPLQSTPTRDVNDDSNSSNPIENRPTIIVVVGATGRVGRIVVQKLLQQQPKCIVRILVRNIEKANELFPKNSRIELYQADLCQYDQYDTVLQQCIQGCTAIISVSGIVRFSKVTDFLPWRIFHLQNVHQWADKTSHPYYGNYLANAKLLQLANQYKVKRFIRLTGLGLAYPAYNPFSILFNILLSCNNRWNLLLEQLLSNREENNVPYLIVRPGGLTDMERNISSTNVQIDPSGILPFPGRIGRTDLAEIICQAATSPLLMGKNTNSYTIACRWVGTDIKPRPQGTMEDGYPSAKECIERMIESNPPALPTPKMKPYGFVTGVTFYILTALMLKLTFYLLSTVVQVFRKF